MCIPTEDLPRVQGASRPLGSQETETSDEIPPEAVQEYMDIMDELEGLAHSATGVKGGEREEDRKESQQGQDETYLDLGLLNYIEYLCYQEDYVTKVGWLRAQGSTTFQGVALQHPDLGCMCVCDVLSVCMCGLALLCLYVYVFLCDCV